MPFKKCSNGTPKVNKKRKRKSPNAVVDLLSPETTIYEYTNSSDSDAQDNASLSPLTLKVNASPVIMIEINVAGSHDGSETTGNGKSDESVDCIIQGSNDDIESDESIKRRLVYDNDDTTVTETVPVKMPSRHEVARQSLLRRNERDGLVMYGINGKGLSFRGRKYNTLKNLPSVADPVNTRKTVPTVADRVDLENDTRIEGSESTRNISQCNDDINYDAAAYAKAMVGFLEMETCAVCGVEESLSEMLKIDEKVIKVIDESGLPRAYSNRVYPPADNIHNWTSGDYALREDVLHNFNENGLLKDLDFVCRLCMKELKQSCQRKKENVDESSTLSDRIPLFALIFECYRGEVPAVLLCLNDVEISMVSIVEVYSTVYAHVKYMRSKTRCYSVLKDVAKVARELPRMPDDETFVKLQTGRKVPVSPGYRPNRVKAALDWLKDNNHFYKDIPIVYPVEWKELGEDDELVLDVHIVEGLAGPDEDGIDLIGQSIPEGTDIYDNDEEEDSGGADILKEFEPKNPDGAGFSHICIMPTSNIIESNNTEVTKILDKDNVSYAHPYHVQDFWYKAFPILYPFGRGIPIASRIKRNFERDYVIYTLKQGRGREFQKNPKYYFLR